MALRSLTTVLPLLTAILLFGSLVVATPPAAAKGCIKGAIVGGVAGHYAGHHGAMGAVAGCIIGRHEANRRARQQQGMDAARH